MLPSIRHWAWIIVTIGFVDVFVSYAVRLGYGVIIPEMIPALGIGRAAAGTIFNAYLLAYLALTPAAGWFTDRLGARSVMTTCSLLLAVGLACMAAADSLIGAAGGFALVGLGATGMWAPLLALIQRWFARRRRGLALGILSTGYGLGFALMGISFPPVARVFGWRWGWLALAAMALVACALNALGIRNDPVDRGRLPWGSFNPPTAGTDCHANPAAGPGLRRALWSNSNFWIIGASYFAVSYGLYGLTTFMVDYARDGLHLPLARAGLLATVHGIGQVIGVLTVLPASDIMGRKRVILFSNGIIALCLVGIRLWGGCWEALLLFVGVTAVFYGATFPIYGACAGDFFPRTHIGTVIGAWTPFFGLGAITTHWASGWLRDTFNAYTPAFTVNAVLGAIGWLLFLLVRPDHRPWEKRRRL
jgi:MFS family permease